ncbi:histidine phosphatase family protein [Chelativorans sp.]|uniref:SixA phosphatase family protein n=1 Tax=Chelativorans sp. TaxID=2203393 RepID=UPI002810AD26|nr:histidine phosphatase family protein [Chelativorans sp.]
MYRLYLLRHAEALHIRPGGSDFDRPLTERGRQDAAALGLRMRAAGYLPSFVLCSSAARAQQTWQEVARKLPHPPPETLYATELYRGDAADYRILVATSPAEESLLVVGHNPMVQELALSLARAGDSAALSAVSAGFPAGGLAVLDLEEPLWRIAPRTGMLAAFLSPRG